jgi:hypothetical protein
MRHAMLELVVELDGEGHQQRREERGQTGAVVFMGVRRRHHLPPRQHLIMDGRRPGASSRRSERPDRWARRV